MLITGFLNYNITYLTAEVQLQVKEACTQKMSREANLFISLPRACTTKRRDSLQSAEVLWKVDVYVTNLHAS